MPSERPSKEADIVIVGAGPAGLTAALYAGRSGRSCVILEKLGVGGQILLTDQIENYPGFMKITGQELAKRFLDQVKAYNVPIQIEEVRSVVDKGERKIVVTEKVDYVAKAVIIATGTRPKKLGIPGEDTFYGKGVSYCALCDGPFYKDKVVGVIGGGDSAVKEAIYLSRIAKKVYIIHRRDSLRAEKAVQERAMRVANIEILWSTVATSINGADRVSSVTLNRLKTGERFTLSLAGVFVYVGLTPNTEIFELEKDEQGFIKVDDELMSSVKGIFAAGDCMHQFNGRTWGQISVCVGDGAKASISADEYISKVLKG
ncbi:MAG: thioredoxin-disulfide reductase [Nitrososphaeria archaeon]